MNIVTYHSTNAKPNEAWLAYVVLPNGEQWLVRCTGHSELEAKTKAQVLWDREQKKYRAHNDLVDAEAGDVKVVHNHGTPNSFSVAPSGRGAHFAGKVWVIHQTTRELKRIDPKELDSHLADGYVRGGPRSK